MSMQLSTGLRNQLLATGSLKSIFEASFIKIYAGPVPAGADAPIGAATLLNTISVNSGGAGINFSDTPINGVISKADAEVWSGLNVAAGTAAFFRHITAADDGTASITQPRIQGLIAAAGAELNLSSTQLANGATQTIDYYSVALPTL